MFFFFFLHFLNQWPSDNSGGVLKWPDFKCFDVPVQKNKYKNSFTLMAASLLQFVAWD